jgi:hypothetical protein
MHRFIIALALVTSLASCKQNETCERGRQSLARAYDSLRQAAAERKLFGTEPQRWSEIETKTDLLQSAFATPQVTWSSAEKARNDVQAKLSSISTTNETGLAVFRQTAQEVFAEQDRFAQKCR